MEAANFPIVWLTWMPRLIAFSWFHNKPRSIFMFSKSNVYSAPINVGSSPTSIEVFLVGTSLKYATGTGPYRSSTCLPVDIKGSPSERMRSEEHTSELQSLRH